MGLATEAGSQPMPTHRSMAALGLSIMILSCQSPTSPEGILLRIEPLEAQYTPGDTLSATFTNVGTIAVSLNPCYSALQRREALLVPSEALIRTGERTVVIVAETAQDGKAQFKPVDVELGDESGGMVEVRKGLAAGMKIVVSGQFLIDSESSLKAAVTRLSDAPPQGEARK